MAEASERGKNTEEIKAKSVIPAQPHEIYGAWLDSAGHGAMTGTKASASNEAGGKFSAWDGYISGHNIELEKDKKIVQAWRTTEFPKDAPDSKLVISLKKVDSGTEVSLVHSNIPPGQGNGYKKGWNDFYFKPMRKYFGRRA